MVPEFGDVTRQIPRPWDSDGHRDTFLLAAIILGGGTFFIHPVLGIVVAVLAICVGCIKFEEHEKENMTSQTTNEKIREHRCCIQCRQPTERLG